MKDPFEGLMSFAQAAQRWGLDSSTLRRAAMDGRFSEYEAKNYGKQWIVTEEAMIKHYGEPKNK